MPLRIYGPDNSNNSDWRSPTEVRVYDNGSFRSVNVAYVYDTGTWKVVFPDPITPNIEIINYLIGDRASVYVDVLLTNCDYIVAQLYLGTTQSNLVSTQTIQTDENVFDQERITFTGLQNNTTYNMKITAYSITENTYTVLTGPATTINVIIPTASITSITNVSLNGVTVNWTSTNQYYWNVEIYRTSDGVPLTARNPGPPPEPIYGPDDRSWTASFNAIANTQYTVKLTVESISEDPAVSFATFTTPNVVQPTLSSLTATSTCNSITVNWSGSNYVSGTVSLWFPDLQLPSQEWTWGSQQKTYTFNSSTLSSYTFTGLPSSTLYVGRIVLVSSTSTSLDSDSVFSWPAGSTSGPGEHPFISTLAPSVNAPTNFTGSSNFYGNGVNLSWTASTANCTTVTGYNVQYKLSSSGTWLTLVNGITATSVNTTLYVTLTANRSYDFRVQATSSAGSSGYATTTLTTNNNPYKIIVYTLPLGTTTFNSVTVYGQLQNISSENVSNNGVSLSFSATAGRGSFSSTSASTNTSGLASVTYTTNSTTGNITFTVTGTGLVQGTYVMGVSLSPALTPSLSVTRNNFGYDVSHSNYNSSWSYSSSVTSPAFIWTGSVSSTAFGVYCPTNNTSAPTASQDANYVYCTTGSWELQGGQVTTTVNSSRTGYNDGSSSVTSNALGGFTAQYTYDWYYYNAQNVETYWGPGDAANNGRRSKGTIYQNSIKGRLLYCKVTAARNYSGSVTGANVANSTKITGT